MACSIGRLRMASAIAFVSALAPALHAQTCSSFSISPASQIFTSQGGTGVITVTTTPASCTSARTASSSASWITITAGASGMGGGTVEYSVQSNSGVVDRTGTITAAGQAFTITQQAAPCTFSIDHASASFLASGGNDQIAIGALPSGCPTTRTVTSNASWITISFGAVGTGAGSTGYTVTANNFLTPRTGTITVAGLAFTVTQAAGTCSFTAGGSSTATIPAAGGSGSFSFTSGNTGCT